MSAKITAKNKTVRGKKKIIVEVDKEMTELTQSDLMKIEMYLSSADIKEIRTPSDKKEKQKKNEKRKKNIKPETQIRNSTKMQDIEDYIKTNDPDGINEYNNQDFSNFMKLRKWFIDKYPNYISEKLKESK